MTENQELEVIFILNDELCSKNDELCIKNDEFWIELMY